MIKQTYYYLQDKVEPCYNLAVEQHLLESVPPEACILYLWQNQRTVVIGKNQNCWKECKLQQLSDDGGQMVRRLSGGGAVYHDLGNLNFTFLIRKQDYDISRQLEVILQALLLLGIPAEKSGRNDLLADGRKFSGNAFYESGDYAYHHGTLMVNVDRSQLGKYLQVSAEKLASKGVSSVQARVVNLNELKPDLTIKELQQALLQAMEIVYGCPIQPWQEEKLDLAQIAIYQTKYASDEWRLGRPIPFSWEMSHRFPWGEIQLQCEVNRGKIQQSNIYSDAMDEELIEKIAEQLQGCAFGSKAMVARLAEMPVRAEIDDLCQYLTELQM